MKRAIITLTVLILGVSFCMTQNIGQAGGTITINGGGTITAIGGEQAAGIGGGRGGEAGTLTMDGNAVVFATSVGDTEESRKTGGILFNGNSGMVYGSVEFDDNFTVPFNYMLTIPEGAILTIPVGKMLTNNGIVINCGTINTYGTWTGNPVQCCDAPRNYTITATVDDKGYIFPSGTESVICGANSVEYTFTPAIGYHIETVVINGVNNYAAVVNGSYTFENVISNQTIHVTFAVHTFTDWQVTQEPTCTVAGVKTEKCAVCGALGTVTKAIDKVPHTFTDWQVTQEPTCTVAGVKTEKCAVCGALGTVTKAIDKVPHTFTDWQVTQEPTCTVAGVKTEKCAVCGALGTVIKAIDKVPHTFTDWQMTQEPTCTVAGVKTEKCAVCGALGTVTKAIDKVPHIFTDWQVTQEPTCTVTGVKTEKCAICGALGTVTEPIEKISHTITAMAGSNGEILPNGTVTVNCSATFAFTPNSGYKINLVLVDGIPNLVAKENGYYTFSDIDVNHEIMVTFIATTTGIDDADANNQLQIFPNPAKDEIFIKSDFPIEKVELCSLTGALLMQENNFNGKISVSALSQGVYLLKVYTNKGCVISKVVKD